MADRGELGGRHLVVAAVELVRLPLPEAARDLEALVHQFGTFTPAALLAERIHTGVGGSEAHRERDPTVAQPVDRGHLARQFPRPPPRRRGQHRAQSDLRGADGGEAQADPRIDTPHRLPHEDAVPAVFLRGGSEVADLGGVRPRDHEAELHDPIVEQIGVTCSGVLRSRP